MQQTTFGPLVMVLLLAACGGDDGAGGPSAREICEAFEASPRSCTDACFAANDGVDTECTGERAAVDALAEERSAYSDCTLDCPAGATCERGGVTFSSDDCDCAAACLAERSAAFQDARTALVRCAERVYAADCL